MTVFKIVRLVHLVGSNLITLVHHYGFYIWCIKRIYDIQLLVILILIKKFLKMLSISNPIINLIKNFITNPITNPISNFQIDNPTAYKPSSTNDYSQFKLISVNAKVFISLVKRRYNLIYSVYKQLFDNYKITKEYYKLNKHIIKELIS